MTFFFKLKLFLKTYYLKKQYKKIYKSSQVFNRLKRCSYQLNYNDFVFLKSPFEEKEFPCDFKVANLIKYLWNNGITTFGSNQPTDIINDIGFITFNTLTVDGNKSILLLIKIFGRENIKFFDGDKLQQKICDKNYTEIKFKLTQDRVNKNSDKVVIEVSNLEDSFHSILFNEKMLERILKILMISPKPEEKIYLGYDNVKKKLKIINNLNFTFIFYSVFPLILSFSFLLSLYILLF